MKPTGIKNVITEILESRKEEGGIKALYFVGCGGSNGALYPAKTFMERECANIKSALINSNEFVYSTPKDLGKNVIVCLSCHKGNTPETINAAKLAKEKGAAVIILTWKEESEITPFGDYIINYTFGDNKDIAGEKIICALLVAVELLNQTEGYEHYEEFMDGVGRIDGIVKHACKHVEKRAELFAKEYKDDKIIYTMASGAGYGAAYMQSICIFMEMQWIHSNCIHSGEYFHGPFEVTDFDVPFVLVKGIGATRELDERAYNFCSKFSQKLAVIDEAEFDLTGIEPGVQEYVAPLLAGTVVREMIDSLAHERGHALSVRRYMWQMEY